MSFPSPKSLSSLSDFTARYSLYDIFTHKVFMDKFVETIPIVVTSILEVASLEDSEIHRIRNTRYKEKLKTCINDNLDIPATKSSGRTPPGPTENGVGGGVQGSPVLPLEDMPSSTLNLDIPAASSSANIECWAGDGENGVGVGVQGLKPESRPPESKPLCSYSRNISFIPSARCSGMTPRL